MINERRPVIGSFASLIESNPKKSALPGSTTGIDILLLVAQTGDAGRDVPVAELLEKSGLRLDQLGELLSDLKKAGFIEMSGDWGRELVSITDLGDTVVQTAVPEPLE